MSKKKLWGIVALAAILAGILTVATVFFTIGFDFSKLSTETYARHTYALGEPFDEIEINSTFFDVQIFPLAEGEEPRVYLPFSGNLSHQVAVQDGKLSISLLDGRAWYEKWGLFNISNENTVIEMHLPHAHYEKLKVKLNSGDILVSKTKGQDNEIVFGAVTLETSTGDINFFADTKAGSSVGLFASTGDITVTGTRGATLSAQVSTGYITLRECALNGISAKTSTSGIRMYGVEAGSMKLEVSSGDIELQRVNADSMVLKADTGDVELEEVLVEGELRAETVTGEIELVRSDAGSLWIETDTGDVEIELLSGKIYHVETDTGDKRYPDHDRNGGRCRVKTDTGDVEITVVGK